MRADLARVGDEEVEREVTTPERELRTFTIYVSKRDGAGELISRRIYCDDWKGLSRLLGAGDRVKVTGYFKHRRYEKDGETKTARNFVVQDLKIERLKTRQQQP